MPQFWEKQATSLVEALKEHMIPFSVDVNHFNNILLPYNLDWHIESTYYPIVAENNLPQKIGNNSLYIDGIIYNMRMQQVVNKLTDFYKQEVQPLPEKSFWKKFLDKSPFQPTIYSVDDALKDIIQNKEIVDIIMSAPAEPYTLLGRFTSINRDINGGYTTSIRPVLVKPHINPEYKSIVHNWETSFTVVEPKKK